MWKLMLSNNKCKREYSSSNANESNVILPCNHLSKVTKIVWKCVASIVSVPVVKVMSYLFLTNLFSE